MRTAVADAALGRADPRTGKREAAPARLRKLLLCIGSNLPILPIWLGHVIELDAVCQKLLPKLCRGDDFTPRPQGMLYPGILDSLLQAIKRARD
jgi:hypothetical protein